MISSDIGYQLRRAGLRVTAPRRSVLEWLGEHPHATVEQVAQGRLRPWDRSLPRLSTTCWRPAPPRGWRAGSNQLGILLDSSAGPGDNHHHVVCRACGRTEDVGTCPTCQALGSDADSPS